MVEGEVGTHLTDGSGAPDGDYVAFVDGGVGDTIPGCADNVREVETFLVGDVVW